MKKITVEASKTYDVIVGSQLIQKISSYLPSLNNGTRMAIISDSNVWPLYGKLLKNQLELAGFTVCVFTFPAGEASKNIKTYCAILNFLAEKRITRADCLIALGGGVTGDITGFAAATFLRGIPYIQIPTSLLAMVDSSVGGKTAIDLPAGKNLVGAFYQPALVLCDIDVLTTLPTDYFLDGCAEIIKYSILYDTELFNHLEISGVDFDREYVISRCIELKKDVVFEDEFDTGSRQKLNLGHTVGHSIETCSNFSISHGCAVAIGLSVITRSATSMNLCERETLDRIITLLNQFNLPVDTDFSVDVLAQAALTDKKRLGDTLNLVIPKRIGCCMIYPISITKLQSIIEIGLNP